MKKRKKIILAVSAIVTIAAVAAAVYKMCIRDSIKRSVS